MALSKREAFLEVFIHLVTHEAHGYSQYARWGNGKKETITLSDGTKVVVALGDRDCSSAVISALQAVGIDTHGASYTGDMYECLMKTGLFDWHPMGDGYIAQPGDIYLNIQKHTATCTSAIPDMLAHFSISENGTIHGQEGDQTGRESCIREYYDKPWDGKLAWKDNGGTVTTVTPAYGSKLTAVASAVIDGQYGNGEERKANLEAAGFDFAEVQAEVNRIIGGGAIQADVTVSTGGYTPGDYITTVSCLNVRTGAGTSSSIKSKSMLTPDGQAHSNGDGQLNTGTAVTVMETSVDGDGNQWGRIPSGWICLEWQGKPYATKR